VSEASDRFTPLRPAPRSRRLVLYLLGPLLWVVALISVGSLVVKKNAVEIGLLIALAAFALAIVLLLPQRTLRIRREQEHASPR
jgi:hypothetical protein